MEASDEITIQYQYTLSDAVHASRLYQATTATRTIGRAVGVLLLALGCVSLYLWGLAWFTVACFLLAVIAGFDLITPLQAWWAFRANAELNAQRWEVTLHSEGIHARTSTLDVQRTWSAYSGAVESERLFLLVYGKWLFAALPKRAFSSEEEIQALRQILESKGIPYRRTKKGWLL
jgi:hypothetical protein